eukprot:31020-Pelagococcus_subviridis.AAC.13
MHARANLLVVARPRALALLRAALEPRRPPRVALAVRPQLGVFFLLPRRAFAFAKAFALAPRRFLRLDPLEPRALLLARLLYRHLPPQLRALALSLRGEGDGVVARAVAVVRVLVLFQKLASTRLRRRRRRKSERRPRRSPLEVIAAVFFLVRRRRSPATRPRLRRGIASRPRLVRPSIEPASSVRRRRRPLRERSIPGSRRRVARGRMELHRAAAIFAIVRRVVPVLVVLAVRPSHFSPPRRRRRRRRARGGRPRPLAVLAYPSRAVLARGVLHARVHGPSPARAIVPGFIAISTPAPAARGVHAQPVESVAEPGVGRADARSRATAARGSGASRRPRAPAPRAAADVDVLAPGSDPLATRAVVSSAARAGRVVVELDVARRASAADAGGGDVTIHRPQQHVGHRRRRARAAALGAERHRALLLLRRVPSRPRVVRVEHPRAVAVHDREQPSREVIVRRVLPREEILHVDVRTFAPDLLQRVANDDQVALLVLRERRVELHLVQRHDVGEHRVDDLRVRAPVAELRDARVVHPQRGVQPVHELALAYRVQLRALDRGRVHEGGVSDGGVVRGRRERHRVVACSPRPRGASSL